MKFSSKVHSIQQMMQLCVITLFTGPVKLGWNWWTWEIEGKIHDGNRSTINSCFDLFEKHIAPKSNALIAVVELKRLFQGSMSLEDFHTKALRLVKEAEYPGGDIQNRILRDTRISGIASDKIHAKIIKEGKDVTLARVMEIDWKFPHREILTMH